MTQIYEPTIQPIKSHTEILMQEAYDRGCADACLKHNLFGEDNE